MESEGQTSYVAATAPKPTTITSNSFTTPKFKKLVEIKGAESGLCTTCMYPTARYAFLKGLRVGLVIIILRTQKKNHYYVSTLLSIVLATVSASRIRFSASSKRRDPWGTAR